MRTPTWKGEARLGLTVYALVLISTVPLWGTWYLIPCAAVAFITSTLILTARFTVRICRDLRTARSTFSITDFPAQETRDDSRS